MSTEALLADTVPESSSAEDLASEHMAPTMVKSYKCKTPAEVFTQEVTESEVNKVFKNVFSEKFLSIEDQMKMVSIGLRAHAQIIQLIEAGQGDGFFSPKPDRGWTEEGRWKRKSLFLEVLKDDEELEKLVFRTTLGMELRQDDDGKHEEREEFFKRIGKMIIKSEKRTMPKSERLRDWFEKKTRRG
ncbi:hypothetical protein EJ08DRAFT_663318 [Tothia fuscella]|uniref:Uncharacterized protein n=1 Tax=Tothia fuscella TaxID=1048955 RepID=A0A9P4NLB9_9PEZI|nr:hypothetical protein EJ08DRAFT_663318 [Tothia fuscella]